MRGRFLIDLGFALPDDLTEVTGAEFGGSFNSTLGGATSFVTVLSLPYLLDGITPMLAAAVDGDTETPVPTAAE